MWKYNIYSSTTEPRNPQHNPSERQTQFYNKGTNTTLVVVFHFSVCWYIQRSSWNLRTGFIQHCTLKPHQWELGGNGGYSKVLVGGPSPGDKADNEDDSNTWGGWVVGIPPGGDGNGSRGTSPNMRVHQDIAGDHNRKGGLPPHLWTLCWGGTYSGYKPDVDTVGPGHSKWTWGVDSDSA